MLSNWIIWSFCFYRWSSYNIKQSLWIVVSGLDAFQAEKVMETLRQLAQDGHTVICSIHQPRGSVYGKFDDIVLLTEGALVYAGPAQDEPLAYFSKFGLLYLSWTLLNIMIISLWLVQFLYMRITEFLAFIWNHYSM